MELVLNSLEIEPLPESGVINEFANRPLLNSNYKAAARKNLINSSKPSVFGMRQRIKYKRFNSVNAVGVALKVSVFVLALSMMF